MKRKTSNIIIIGLFYTYSSFVYLVIKSGDNILSGVIKERIMKAIECNN